RAGSVGFGAHAPERGFELFDGRAICLGKSDDGHTGQLGALPDGLQAAAFVDMLRGLELRVVDERTLSLAATHLLERLERTLGFDKLEVCQFEGAPRYHSLDERRIGGERGS